MLTVKPCGSVLLANQPMNIVLGWWIDKKFGAIPQASISSNAGCHCGSEDAIKKLLAAFSGLTEQQRHAVGLTDGTHGVCRFLIVIFNRKCGRQTPDVIFLARLVFGIFVDG